MSRASVGDRSAVRFEELPNLQGLFRACDPHLLARVVIEDYACNDGSAAVLGSKRRRAMRKRVCSTLDAMCLLNIDERAIGYQMLVPETRYVLNARNGMVARCLCATIVLPPYVEDMKVLRRAMGGHATSYKQVRKADKRLLETELRFSRAGRSVSMSQGSYTLRPWEETLSCKVWLGGDWCRRERYSILASAFWEMTFYGFEYDRVQARMAQKKAERRAGKLEDGEGERVTSVHDGADSGGMPPDYGLREPDRFSAAYHKRLVRWVAVLNHNARYDFYGYQLDLAQRLKNR